MFTGVVHVRFVSLVYFGERLVTGAGLGLVHSLVLEKVQLFAIYGIIKALLVVSKIDSLCV